jgi:hypothetical protein
MQDRTPDDVAMDDVGAPDDLFEIDTSVAHPARRYNYFLGGTDNFAADRISGDAGLAVFPTANQSRSRDPVRAIGRRSPTSSRACDWFLPASSRSPTGAVRSRPPTDIERAGNLRARGGVPSVWAGANRSKEQADRGASSTTPRP